MFLEYDLKKSYTALGVTMLVMLLANNVLQFPLYFLNNVIAFILPFGIGKFIMALLQAAMYSATMVITILCAAGCFKCNIRFLFPICETKRDYMLPAIGTGLGIGMLGNLLAMVLSMLLALLGIDAGGAAPVFIGGPLTRTITFLSLTVLPAIFEELLFRGAILQSLRKYGDKNAVLLSALVFAVCHNSLPQAVNAFIMGLCLATFTIRTGSLLTSMVIHLSYNSLACFLTLLSQKSRYGVSELITWTIIILVIIGGAVAAKTLRHRFGPIFWVSNEGVPRAQMLYSAVTSFPFVIAVALYLVVISKGMYFYGVG